MINVNSTSPTSRVGLNMDIPEGAPPVTPPPSTPAAPPKKVSKKKQKQFTREEAMTYGMAFPDFRERTQSYLMNPNAKGPAQLAQNAIQRANEEINKGNFAAAQNYLNAASKTAANANNTAINQALSDAQSRLGQASGTGEAGAAGEGDTMGPADILDYTTRAGAAAAALAAEFNQAQIEDANLRAAYGRLIRDAQRRQYYDRQQAAGQLAERGLSFAPGVRAIAARAASAPGQAEALARAAEQQAEQNAIIGSLINSISRYSSDLTAADIENYNAQINAIRQGFGV